MRNRPHLVLDGLTIAARALGACRAVVYVADGELAAGIRDRGVEEAQRRSGQ